MAPTTRCPSWLAVQTTPAGHPLYACLSPQPPTRQAVAAFAASHIAPSAVVVSGGLRCFMATTHIGVDHERFTTRGGNASMKLPQFKAINTLLGNLKTVAPGGLEPEHHVARNAGRWLA